MKNQSVEDIEFNKKEIKPDIFNDNSLRLSKDNPMIKPEENNPNILNLQDEQSEKKLYLENDFEKLPESQNSYLLFISNAHNKVSDKINENMYYIKSIVIFIILILYFAFFIWSVLCKTKEGTIFTVEDNIRLIWMTALLVLWIMYKSFMGILKWNDIEVEKQIHAPPWMGKCLMICMYVIILVISVAILAYIIFVHAISTPYNLVSCSGTVCLILFSFIFSKFPNMIQWKTVFMGLLLQFIFAFLILSTHPGYMVFKFIGDRISVVLRFIDAGTVMVFGSSFSPGNFAFRILPMIIYLGSLISVLFYLGIIQVVVIAIGTVMQVVMGTTCAESLNAGANIFIGMTESPLLIKPYLGMMTNSELHSVMTSGFATIAGTVLGAFISFGISASHLLSASVMSAPAALAISKLMYPETKKSKNTNKEIGVLSESPYSNIVEAASAGASDSIGLVAHIGANLIAFLSLLALVNSILAWFGERACMQRQLSFELICSYLFWPLTVVMGIDIHDCRKVAELIGIKIFLNEFVAYQRLGQMLDNKKTLDSLNLTQSTVIYLFDDVLITFANGTSLTLKGGILESERSVVIATYALCGFANICSIGIMLSGLSALIPHRRQDLSKMVIRSMIAGNIASFLTGCIAGMFFKYSNP